MTRQEEQNIIARVLAGDTDAFELLVRAHEKLVYNLTLRILGNEQDALDASQEAFFRAYRALESFRADSKFSVWLYRLTSNVCLDMLRQRSRTGDPLSLTTDEGMELSLPDERFDPETELEKKELRRAVQEGLQALEPAFRQALVLREINGLSYEEIGQVMGLESGTVKSRIFRARRKLAAYLTASGNISAHKPSKDTGKGGAEREKL